MNKYTTLVGHNDQTACSGMSAGSQSFELVSMDSSAPIPLPSSRFPLLSSALRYLMEIISLVVPIAFAVCYFTFIASDIFVSETKFIIRGPSRADPGALASVVQSQTASRALDDSYAVMEFIKSRDAAQLLANEDELLTIMSRPEADLFSRYPSIFLRQNKEQFFNAYRRLVLVEVDPSTGIVDLEVSAFRPEDAHRLAAAILVKAEYFINRLDARMNERELDFASILYQKARSRLDQAEERLRAFRNKEMIVDPGREGTEALTFLGRIDSEISLLEASLAQQLAEAPTSPTVLPLREKIKSLQEQIGQRRRQVAGDPESIATKMQAFDMLTLEREFAGHTLRAAAARVERGQQEEQHQRLYLERIVEPSFPDEPLMPKRLLGTLFACALSLATYWILRTIVFSALEHRA